MRRLSDFFILCSGIHPPFLEQCPTERSKYTGLGAAIFFTGVFAFFAAAYALFTVFDNYVLAILLGLVWGFMIFNLDRYIVSSMRKEGGFFRELWSALPRIVVAIIISMVIAKPLELRIFQKEIEPELVIMEQQAFARQEQEVRHRFSDTDLKLQEEISLLNRQLKERQDHKEELVRIAQEEADGTGGSRKKNLGPIYKLKKQDALNAERELDEFRREHDARMTVLDKRRNQIDSVRSMELNNLELNKRDGLAARMEALDHLRSASDSIWWASFFILLLLIALETVPVFVKLISAKGPYDNLLRVEESRFLFQETEHLAKSSADLRKRSGEFPQEENSFIQERLNNIIRRS
jgi:hypothetical protein